MSICILSNNSKAFTNSRRVRLRGQLGHFDDRFPRYILDLIPLAPGPLGEGFQTKELFQNGAKPDLPGLTHERLQEKGTQRRIKADHGVTIGFAPLGDCDFMSAIQ